MINLELFKEFLLNLIKDYGYFGIFLVGFSEPIFQPFPTEIFIAAGLLAGLDWKLVWLISTIACNFGAIITYYLAKKYGIGITDFSIGFGKEIFGWNDKSGTRWKICWIPLGGYVKFFGDRNVFSQTEQQEVVDKYSEEDKNKLKGEI